MAKLRISKKPKDARALGEDRIDLVLGLQIHNNIQLAVYFSYR